jgi:hypothetical protein
MKAALALPRPPPLVRLAPDVFLALVLLPRALVVARLALFFAAPFRAVFLPLAVLRLAAFLAIESPLKGNDTTNRRSSIVNCES